MTAAAQAGAIASTEARPNIAIQTPRGGMCSRYTTRFAGFEIGRTKLAALAMNAQIIRYGSGRALAARVVARMAGASTPTLALRKDRNRRPPETIRRGAGRPPARNRCTRRRKLLAAPAPPSSFRRKEWHPPPHRLKSRACRKQPRQASSGDRPSGQCQPTSTSRMDRVMMIQMM